MICSNYVIYQVSIAIFILSLFTYFGLNHHNKANFICKEIRSQVG